MYYTINADRVIDSLFIFIVPLRRPYVAADWEIFKSASNFAKIRYEVNEIVASDLLSAPWASQLGDRQVIVCHS